MTRRSKRTALTAYREGDFDSLSLYLDKEGVTEIIVKRWQWRRAYRALIRNLGKPDESIELDEEIEECSIT